MSFGRTARCSWALVAQGGARSSSSDCFAVTAALVRGQAAAPGAGVGRAGHLSPGHTGHDSDSGGSRANSVDSARTGSSGGKRSKRGAPGPGVTVAPTPALVLGASDEWERPMVLDREADGGSGGLGKSTGKYPIF